MQHVEKELISELTSLATKTASLFDFEVLAIDFMRSSENNEFYFTEINLNPGWEISDENATNVDLSAVTADYFESLVK